MTDQPTTTTFIASGPVPVPVQIQPATPPTPVATAQPVPVSIQNPQNGPPESVQPHAGPITPETPLTALPGLPQPLPGAFDPDPVDENGKPLRKVNAVGQQILANIEAGRAAGTGGMGKREAAKVAKADADQIEAATKAATKARNAEMLRQMHAIHSDVEQLKLDNTEHIIRQMIINSDKALAVLFQMAVSPLANATQLKAATFILEKTSHIGQDRIGTKIDFEGLDVSERMALITDMLAAGAISVADHDTLMAGLKSQAEVLAKDDAARLDELEEMLGKKTIDHDTRG